MSERPKPPKREVYTGVLECAIVMARIPEKEKQEARAELAELRRASAVVETLDASSSFDATRILGTPAIVYWEDANGRHRGEGSTLADAVLAAAQAQATNPGAAGKGA